MRVAAIAIMVILMLSGGMAMLGGSYTGHATTEQDDSGMFVWSGTISVHIKYFQCDPNLDTFGKPDPYFVVFINQYEIKSQVWDGEDNFAPDWTATKSITTRDPEVWIEISAWDKDTGLYGRDDLIDLSPHDGFSLDLLYNLKTHSWTGDITGNHARGNRPYDWGDIWFEITSTPDLESNYQKNVNLPYSGYARVDGSPIMVNGKKVGTFSNPSDAYLFSASTGQTISAALLPSPHADLALRLYSPSGKLLTTSDSAGYGGKEQIYYKAPENGQYKLVVDTTHGYGAYYLTINDDFHNIVPGTSVSVKLQRAYLLSKGWDNINIRMMGYHVAVTLTNPTSQSGYVRVHFFNLDPDYVVTNFDGFAERGKYSLNLVIPLNASETKTITVHPWAEPSDNFWIFAMGDNRPGCGIYDHPYIQKAQYTLFTHYYTDVIRTPIGWDDGDLVSGFGAALVTEYKGKSYDALDYVYDMEYNRFYMLTGTSDDFFFTTVGNHDVTRHPDQPQHEGEHIYEEYLGNLYYSFNFSNTHFVFPDDYQDGFWHHGSWSYGKGETPWWYAQDPGKSTLYPHYGGYIYGKQLTWLATDLANSQSYTHRIVVMHMPIITPPGKEKDGNDSFINNTNRLQVMNIFKAFHVDYLVVAHIHNYTYYYTNLNGNTITASMSPQGQYSVFTLLTGGAGAHNNYEWIVPAIEGSYHFVLIHVNGNEINYYIYKYENLTDSNGNPLTSVTYAGANNGTETNEWGTIKNSARYNFPYIRMKFYMSPHHDHYHAYSKLTKSYLKTEEHTFKHYTVVYVYASAPAYSTNNILVYAYVPQTPEFNTTTMVGVLVLLVGIVVAMRRK